MAIRPASKCKPGAKGWCVSRVLGTSPVTGKVERLHRHVQGSLRDAKRFENTRVVEFAQQRPPAESTDPNPRFEDVWAEWVKLQPRSPKWKYTMEGMLRCSIVPHLGHRRLGQLTATHVEKMVGFWMEKGRCAAEGRRYGQTVKRIVMWGDREGWMVHPSMFKPLQLPEVVAQEPLPPQADWVKRLLAFTPQRSDAWWKAALTVDLALGLRVGELAGLKVKDVDLQTGVVSIVRQITRLRQDGDGNGPTFREALVKGKLSRRIRLHPEALDALRAYMEAEWEDVDGVGEAYLFSPVADHSRPFHPTSLGAKFRWACRQAGLPDTFKKHHTRRLVANRLIQQGATINDLMAWMGWSELETAKHYIRITTDEDRLEGLAAMIGRVWREVR